MSEAIVVLVPNGGIWQTAVVPPVIFSDRGLTQIIWRTAGPNNPTFPEHHFFRWKTQPAPLGGRLPVRSADGRTLTLDYENAGGSVWVYGVAIQNDIVPPILIDPEIDNGPPGGDDDDKDKDKDKDKNK